MGLFRKEKKGTRLGQRDGRYKQLDGSTASSVSSWVPGQLINAMDRRIAAGEFRSRSDFLLAAMRHYSEYLDKKDVRRNR